MTTQSNYNCEKCRGEELQVFMRMHVEGGLTSGEALGKPPKEDESEWEVGKASGKREQLLQSSEAARVCDSTHVKCPERESQRHRDGWMVA